MTQKMSEHHTGCHRQAAADDGRAGRFAEEDAALISRMNKGDEKAFALLYDKYAGRVFGFMRRILGDEALAEDITQFCFMQVWINRRRISSDRSLPAYLYVVARNAAYKEFRRQLSAEKYIRYATGGDRTYEEADYGKVDLGIIREEVSKLIASLPESRKKIFVMRRIKGMTPSEIAEELGISVKTVEAQISRAGIALRQAISRILLFLALSASAGYSDDRFSLFPGKINTILTIWKEANSCGNTGKLAVTELNIAGEH